ncbi:MAG: hypothetical protein ACR2OH_07730 [Microthrixaceae bacterium]
MRLDSEWDKYLSGEDFSSSHAFPIPAEHRRPLTRFEVGSAIAAGRAVLHVGCVDHMPLIEDKIAAGTWMHEVLSDAAGRCGGVDINADGIDHMRSMGYDDLHVGNVDAPERELLESGWEVLFLGEMLEHTDDPIGFLASVRNAWAGSAESVVVTVPNAFSWSTLRPTLRSTEVINTDHRFWFTPYTAAKVAVRAGFKVDSIHLCESFPETHDVGVASRIRQRVLREVLSRRPIYQSSVVLELLF